MTEQMKLQTKWTFVEVPKINFVKFLISLVPILLLGAGCVSTTTTEDSTKNRDETVTTTFTELTDTFSVNGAPMWLFVIDDGEADPALSTERDGSIYMGRLNLENPRSEITWKRVVSSSDIGGSRVADHWHIFTNDYHWIAFSVQEANASYLIKLDTNFERVSLTNITRNSSIPTNDLFLVDEADGVTVGHFRPDYGHRLFRMNLNGTLKETIDIGGGSTRHGNGSSAYRTENGFSVIAGKTLNYLEQSPLYKLDYDNDWKFVKQTMLVDDDETNVSMTSAVELPDGSLIVTTRVTESYPRGALPPPKNPGEPLSDDGGSIVRFVFDANGNELSREVLQEATTEHRPHMTLIGDLLITTWDGSGGARLRIDRIQ